MFRLTTFGGIDLVGPDGERVSSVLHQPKRMAALAYLALAGPAASRSRDAMLLLFWPDASDREARLSLNQTLHVLRQVLGPAAIVNHGPGEVAISGDVLWCDVVAFRDALERGDAPAALKLYRGDLMPGSFPGASPEFDQWIDQLRTELRRLATATASELSDLAEERGQLAEAAEWGRRCTQMSPDDEACAQRLIRLFDLMGNRAGALQTFEAFSRLLRREYDAEPAVETQLLIARVRSRSEPAVRSRAGELPPTVRGDGSTPRQSEAAAVASERNAEPRLLDTPADPQPHAPRIGPNRVGVGFGLLGAALVAALVAAGLIAWSMSKRELDQESTVMPETTGIMVESFSGSGVPAVNDLARAFTAGIVDQLAQVPSFSVVDSAQPVSGRAASTAPLFSTPQLLVTGSVIESGRTVRVNVRITDAVSGATVQTGVFNHQLGDQLPLVDTVSHEISSLVRTAAGHDVRLRKWRAEIHDKRVYTLMQAVAESDDIATQLARSGDFTGVARALLSADSSLVEVERITPEWGEPRAQRAQGLERLAMLYYNSPAQHHQRFTALLGHAMREAGNAITIDPHDAAALEAFGAISYMYWMTVPMGRDSSLALLSRTEQALRAAIAEEPTRAEAWSTLASILFHRADYAGAYMAGIHAYRADAYLKNPQEILSGLVASAYEIGNDSAASAWCDELNERVERSWPGAYCQLKLLVWHGSRLPEAQAISRAWMLATDTVWASAPDQHIESHLQMLTAAVLARYGLRDSAAAVAARATVADSDDPELAVLEARTQLLLGQDDRAARLLTRYVAAKPIQTAGIARSRQFASLLKLQHQFTQMGVPVALR